jgi:hypothetical protein
MDGHLGNNLPEFLHTYGVYLQEPVRIEEPIPT